MACDHWFVGDEHLLFAALPASSATLRRLPERFDVSRFGRDVLAAAHRRVKIDERTSATIARIAALDSAETDRQLERCADALHMVSVTTTAHTALRAVAVSGSAAPWEPGELCVKLLASDRLPNAVKSALAEQDCTTAELAAALEAHPWDTIVGLVEEAATTVTD